MADKEIRAWKKVYESDIPYVVSELKESVGRPALLILTGDLGAGKTTFCKSFLQSDMTQSPTYSVVTELNNAVHADFYRIESPEEIVHLELDSYLENKDYFIVEWGKKYLRVLSRQIDELFQIYEVVITNNENSSKDSRDYQLVKIDRTVY